MDLLEYIDDLTEARKKRSKRKRVTDAVKGAMKRVRGLLGRKDKDKDEKEAKAKKERRAKIPSKPKADSKKKSEPEAKGGGSSRLSASKSQHNPFRNHSDLGPTEVYRTPPAPPSPSSTRNHSEKGCWKCTRTGPYQQRCVGQCKKNSGRVLNIKIKRDYKRRYNKAYKAHRTKKRAEARASGKPHPRYSPRKGRKF